MGRPWLSQAFLIFTILIMWVDSWHFPVKSSHGPIPKLTVIVWSFKHKCKRGFNTINRASYQLKEKKKSHPKQFRLFKPPLIKQKFPVPCFPVYASLANWSTSWKQFPGRINLKVWVSFNTQGCCYWWKPYCSWYILKCLLYLTLIHHCWGSF